MSGKPTDGTITIPVLATEAAHEAMLAEAAAVAPPVETTPPATSNSRLFTEDEIAAARRQEKDKLYPKLTELEEQLRVIQAEREEAQRVAAEAAEAEAQARREREEAELSARDLVLKKEDEWKQTFNSAQAEWEQKFNALQQESEARQALLERERQFQELVSYKNRRIAEEQDNLMPELLDLITGNTPEEIDLSISTVAAKSSAIVQSIQQSLPQQQQRLRGISPVGSTPSGPLENATEQHTLTEADIAGMSMDQYALVRDRLLSASARGR